MSKRYFIDYQNGGTSSKNFYLPCDITHYTAKKYYGNLTPPLVNTIIGDSDPYSKSLNQNIFNGKGYFQDTFFQLYNGSCYINLINGYFVKQNDLDKNIMVNEFIRDHNIILEDIDNSEQSKGGNFIGAPDGSIICVGDVEQVIKNKINEFSNKKIIQLNCSFKVGGNVNRLTLFQITSNVFRHVDEIMSFMPYGVNNFKIWFYDKFTLTPSKKMMFTYLYNINRLSKNLELIYESNLMNKISKEISECSKQMRKIINNNSEYIPINQAYQNISNEIYELEDLTEKTEGDKEHLNKKLIELEFEKDKLEKQKNEIEMKIRNSSIFTEKNKHYKYNETHLSKKIYDEIERIVSDDELEDYIKMLNKEREDNLELLSQNIFGGTYLENQDKFVFFDYDPSDKSIFNRLWYETPSRVKCLFPSTSNDKKIEEEMKKVSSYISGLKPTCHFIGGLPKPVLKEPEGTLHCLIKQRFIKP